MESAVMTLGVEAGDLADERREYMQAKMAKAKAENAVLHAIVEAVRPALPAIASKTQMGGPLKRAIELGSFNGRALYLGEEGDFFSLDAKLSITCFTVEEVLNQTSLSAILAVLLTAVRAQTGKLDPRTEQIRREAGILEGIALAFKAGGVR